MTPHPIVRDLTVCALLAVGVWFATDAATIATGHVWPAILARFAWALIVAAAAGIIAREVQ